MFSVTGVDGQVFRGASEDLIKVQGLPALRDSRRIAHHTDEPPQPSTSAADPARSHAAGAAAAYGKVLAQGTDRGPLYRAHQIMSTHVVTLLADSGVDHARRTLREHRVGQAPVLDRRSRLVGLVSRERLLHVLNDEDGDFKNLQPRTVADVMVTPVVAADPDADVRRIARVMLDYQLPAVPIVEATGKLVGIVSRGDVLRVVLIDPPLTLWV